VPPLTSGIILAGCVIALCYNLVHAAVIKVTSSVTTTGTARAHHYPPRTIALRTAAQQTGYLELCDDVLLA
jgi:hypothetical protein